MTEIGLFSTNLSNTAPSIGGLLQDKIEESPSYTISSHLYTTGIRMATFPIWRDARQYTRLHTTEHEDEMMIACWRGVFTDFGPLDEVAARQFVADRACYALRDALVCRVG